MRIFIVNLHGLVKGSGLEIGRDADNGGQTKYVLELAEYLSKHEQVSHVHLFTRKIKDSEVSSEYGATIEEINPKFDIRRIEFGGLSYKMKESLWEHVDEFVENAAPGIDRLSAMPPCGRVQRCGERRANDPDAGDSLPHLRHTSLHACDNFFC